MRPGFWDSAITFRQCTAEKVSFVLLNQLDLILTLYALSLGLYELNPWMRELVTAPFQLLLIKVIIPLFLAWLVPGRLLLPAVTLLVFIVSWDVKELLAFLL